MNILINSTKTSSKLLLSLLLCLAMFSTAFASSADAAVKKHGKTGTYNGMSYIAHEDIPAYMNASKKQINDTIKKGSKSGLVKVLNLPSVYLKNRFLRNGQLLLI